jgi:hypothetical protein
MDHLQEMTAFLWLLDMFTLSPSPTEGGQNTANQLRDQEDPRRTSPHHTVIINTIGIMILHGIRPGPVFIMCLRLEALIKD